MNREKCSNEIPRRTIIVKRIQIKAKNITNFDFECMQRRNNFIYNVLFLVFLAEIRLTLFLSSLLFN